MSATRGIAAPFAAGAALTIALLAGIAAALGVEARVVIGDHHYQTQKFPDGHGAREWCDWNERTFKRRCIGDSR